MAAVLAPPVHIEPTLSDPPAIEGDPGQPPTEATATGVQVLLGESETNIPIEIAQDVHEDVDARSISNIAALPVLERDAPPGLQHRDNATDIEVFNLVETLPEASNVPKRLQWSREIACHMSFLLAGYK